MVIFEDGFESGNFVAWTNVQGYGGGVASVSMEQPRSGIYSAKFEVAPTIEWAGALCSHNVTGHIELYARAYFLIGQGLPLPAGWFDILTFEEAGEPYEYIASVGISKRTGVDAWRLRARNGTGWVSVDGSPVPNTLQYICVELHVTVDAVNGAVQLFVNGVLDAQILGIDTTAFVLGRARFGIHKPSEASETGAGNLNLIVYVDNCVVAEEYIGPEEPPPPPCESYLTQAECEAALCYWYDGTCHSEPAPPPPPPPDILPLLVLCGIVLLLTQI